MNTRYAVQLITTLPGGTAKISFSKPQLSRNGAEVNLGIDLLNAGAASSVPELRAEVYDAQGKLVARAEAGKKRLYPGGGHTQSSNSAHSQPPNTPSWCWPTTA